MWILWMLLGALVTAAVAFLGLGIGSFFTSIIAGGILLGSIWYGLTELKRLRVGIEEQNRLLKGDPPPIPPGGPFTTAEEAEAARIANIPLAKR